MPDLTCDTENGEIHGDEDRTHDAADEHHHDRLEHRGEGRDGDIRESVRPAVREALRDAVLEER